VSEYRPPRLPLALLDEPLAVCRLGPGDPVPGWALASRPLSVVARTPTELSLLVAEAAVPAERAREPGLRVEGGWRAFVVRGPLPFDLVGIFASMAQPLAEAGLSIFALSTFDTDFLLVKGADLTRARAVLEAAGHDVIAARQER
jgi:uncharacterized protein